MVYGAWYDEWYIVWYSIWYGLYMIVTIIVYDVLFMITDVYGMMNGILYITLQYISQTLLHGTI